MELESSNLININNSRTGRCFKMFSFEKDIKKLTNLLHSVLGVINLSIILFAFIFFLFNRIKDFICSINFDFLKKKSKDLRYYQDPQHYFCDNVGKLFNRELEDKIILYNVSLNNSNFDMFIFDDYDYYSWQIKINQSFNPEGTLEMLKAIKYYADKNDYLEEDIAIIDIGANVGWYTNFFGNLKYTVFSFESLPDNNYLLRKNFCRNNKDYFGPGSTVTIINEALHPSETFCDYYKDSKSSKKSLILCDKTKEKNLDKDYIKIAKIKANKLSNFIPLINGKRLTLIKLDLEYEGEMAIESGKELILKYHIPYIFIEFNMSMFSLHETRPQDFLRFFTQNGYKISLSGFLSEEFISIEDLMKTKFITINLYLVFVGG